MGGSEKEVWYDWPLILGYHSVSTHRRDALAVRTQDFEHQMSWLAARGYRSITLGSYIEGSFSFGDKIVILTFDDGYMDNYTEAFPILEKYGFVGTFFVVSDYVGTDHVFYWDERKLESSSSRDWYALLRWEHLEEMLRHGMEVGSHTCTHPELTKVSREACTEELLRSRRDLEARLGSEIVSFCYPRGDLDDRVIQCVRDTGYSCAVVSPERRGIPLQKFTLRRIGIHQRNSRLVFRIKVSRMLRRSYERLMPAHAR